MRKNQFIAIAVLLLMISQLLLTSCASDIVEPSPAPSASSMTLGSRAVSQTVAE